MLIILNRHFSGATKMLIPTIFLERLEEHFKNEQISDDENLLLVKHAAGNWYSTVRYTWTYI